MPFVCQLTRCTAHRSLQFTAECPRIRTMSNETPASLGGANAVDPLRARPSADPRTAMKSRDKVSVDTLRCLLSVLDNAGAQDPKVFAASTEVPRRSLTEDEVQALMRAQVTSRRAAVIDDERVGRHQDAARLRAELVLISRYVAYSSASPLGTAKKPSPNSHDNLEPHHRRAVKIFKNNRNKPASPGVCSWEWPCSSLSRRAQS
jgi:uncharacterized protein YqeY